MVAKLNPLIVPALRKSKAPRLAKIVELAEFFDDLSELNDLAYGITQPSSEADWLDAPVYLHGIRLRPLSLGAYMWVEKKAFKWFDAERQSFWCNLALAYAMSYSRSPIHLKRIRDAASCKSALNAWLQACGCTYKELVEAIERILHTQQTGRDSEEKPSKGNEYGPVIALLCNEYGRDPDYWIWSVSMDTVSGMIEEYTVKMRAQEAAAKGKGGHKPSSPAYIKACKVFMDAICKFRQKAEAMDG